MLRPSYSELMDVVMKEEKLDPRVVSRYTLVLAAAKRARQLTDGMPPLTYVPQTDRPVSIAVKELHEGKLKIKVEADLLDGHTQRLLRQKDRLRAISGLSKDDLREELKDAYEPDDLYRELDYGDDASEALLLASLESGEPVQNTDFDELFDEPLVDDELLVDDGPLVDDEALALADDEPLDEDMSQIYVSGLSEEVDGE